MEQTLQALGGILLKALPTVVFLIFLYIYLKLMLFGPLEKVLKQRDALTAGTRKIADDSLAAAELKAAEYEAKLRQARAEIYREQEETRRGWLEDQAAQLAEAHARAETMVKQAREDIAKEAAEARQSLIQTSATLADEIANVVLAKGAGR